MRATLLAGLVFAACTGPAAADEKPVRVRLETDQGDIEVELDAAKAPATVANFLSYVDGKFYDGGRFHRTVTPDNQPDNKVKIEVIQAGINPDKAKDEFPPIKLERTQRHQALPQGRHHLDGPRRPRHGDRRTSSSASATSPNSTSAASATPTARASPPSAGWSRAWTW